MNARSLNIGTPDFTINSRAPFVRKTVTVSANTSSTVTQVFHGINMNQYDVAPVGYFYINMSPGIRAAYM